jgi:hypothetical protein
MKFHYVLAIMAILFVISYDPKSGTIEKFVNPIAKKAGCCDNTEYMADNKKQCEHAHFQGVTFANESYGCPLKTPEVNMGAVIGR